MGVKFVHTYIPKSNEFVAGVVSIWAYTYWYFVRMASF